MKQGLNLINSNTILRRSQNFTPGLLNPMTGVVAKKRLAEDMISRVDDLPALPSVVSDIMALIDDDKSNAKNFEKHLKRDQSLTARLLKIVNSSFFGLRNKISSIPQAVVMIGYNSLKNLVLAASTSKLLEGAFPGYGFKERGLWQHSFMAATWAKNIGLEIGIDTQNVEDLFVAGLLHDVGKLILASYISDNCKEMIVNLMKFDGNIEDAEKAVVGIDHSEIGSRIAQKWNFSNKLATIIKYHHKVEMAHDYQTEISIIHLVNYLLITGCFGIYNNFPVKSFFYDDCTKVLKINSEKIADFQDRINKSAEKWEEF